MAYERPAAPRGNRDPSAPARQDGAGQEGGERSNTRSTPTPKMLEFARNVAEQLAVELPAEAETSFDACRDFLDKHPLPPTDKQINLAERIAQEDGVEIPPEARAERRKMGEWLDSMMAKRK